MHAVERHTGIQPPCVLMAPHITLQRPFNHVTPETATRHLETVAGKAKAGIVRTCGIWNFGKQFIVLPLRPTRPIASLWVHIGATIESLRGFKPDEYADLDTLHITLAQDTSSIFHLAWPHLKDMRPKEMEIPISCIELWRKGTARSKKKGKWLQASSCGRRTRRARHEPCGFCFYVKSN